MVLLPYPQSVQLLLRSGEETLPVYLEDSFNSYFLQIDPLPHGQSIDCGQDVPLLVYVQRLCMDYSLRPFSR